MFGRAILLTLALGLMAGCSSDTHYSDWVSNKDMSAEISVIGTDKYVIVNSRLKDHSVTTDYVRLSSGDTLVATTKKEARLPSYQSDLFNNLDNISDDYKVLQEWRNYTQYLYGIELNTSALSKLWYAGIFSIFDNNDTFYITLERANYRDITGSYAILPEPFTITEPISENGAYSRSLDDITLQWTGNDNVDRVVVRAITTCGEGQVDGDWSIELAPDQYSYTIPAATLDTYRVRGACKTSLNVQRTIDGTLSEEFGKGGTITGLQSRYVLVDTYD